MIEILTTGVPNTVQDGGRHGYLSSGVSRCGAMDRLSLEIGNALLGNALLGNAILGNEAGAAGIEIAFFPFRLRFGQDARFALTGADCRATLDAVPVPPFWARGAKAGQVLSLGAPACGARAYVTVAGGIAVPAVMGSRSTDLKGGFGGLAGRGLRRGDRLGIGETVPMSGVDDVGFGAVFPLCPIASSGAGMDATNVRFIEAAEFSVFDPSSRAAFANSDWQVGTEANRMGYRLNGPTLRLEQPLELFSHGILPGIVQVPSNGQPIVQLADANTCGGYPKIAAVIEADLWRIAQAPVGSRLRFVVADAEEAVDALRFQCAKLAEIRATARHFLERG